MSLADILRIIRDPTVDSVLASFRTAVDDLRAIAAINTDKNIVLANKRYEIGRQIGENKAEAERAMLVADRIDALIK